ncbi:condensation protein [Nostoc sp. KVJ3]|uniref:condensation domain-containing protein n=1 Tax=Nostoc sp. KVJ3 TaxID=457945 RepID=UPI0022375DE0|nr:condensation domain-containing protein [Nostoc sp. KVJ3]MCW5318637.1 condensation protein [Nostoc sp. KVJ3]
MSNTLKCISAYSPEQRRALLAQLLQKNGSNPKLFPLSSGQRRIWCFEELAPDISLYNIPLAFRLKGKLNITSLEKSINEILRRHEALRTNFLTVNGQPVQLVAPVLTLKLPTINLCNLPELKRELEVSRLAVEEAQKPFNLTRDPLVRATLLWLSEKEHVLLLTMHHTISDGWSIGVLLRELSILYKAFSSKMDSPLPELPIQYGNYVRWQMKGLPSDILYTQLTYWKKQLVDPLPVVALPTDKPRPPVRSFMGALQSVVIPASLTAALKTLSRRQGVTLFMTLLAAFQVLLYRYTGQEDILIATPIAGRKNVETEELIGVFINVVILRTNLSGNQSFQELLSQVRKVALEAYAHQDLSFEQLVEIMQPMRDLSYIPLFQVMFVLQNAPIPDLNLPSITISALEVHSGTSKFDLTLELVETEDGFSGGFEYNTDLFDPLTMVRMSSHFQALLEGIIFHSEQQISALPL